MNPRYYDSPGSSAVHGLAMARLRLAERIQAFVDVYDVDRECPHGTLPTDGDVECQCWSVEDRVAA